MNDGSIASEITAANAPRRLAAVDHRMVDASLLARPPASLLDETGAEAWRTLTSMQLKRDLYAKETYFREAWIDVVATYGAHACERLQRLAVLVLKPDTFHGRRALAVMDFFLEHGFVPVTWREFRYTRWSMREDWRYQLNQLSTDRLLLNERLLTSQDSTLIVFRDAPGQCGRLPATVRMQALKGPSLPEQHQPHHLRAVLGSVNRLFKFVHTADEPADIVRECGILFESDERRALLRDAWRPVDGACERLRAHLLDKTAAIPAHPLDLGQSLLALDRAAATAGDPARAFAVAVRQLAAPGGRPEGSWLNLAAFDARLAACRIELSLLDRLVIAANLIHHSFPLEFAVMRGDGLAGWLAGDGVPLVATASP